MRESVRNTASRSCFCDYLYMWERKEWGVNDNNTVTLIHQHPYNTRALARSRSPNDSTSVCVYREWIETAGSTVYLSSALIGQGSGHKDVYLEIWLVWLMVMSFMSTGNYGGCCSLGPVTFIPERQVLNQFAHPQAWLKSAWIKQNADFWPDVISQCQANTP